MSDWLSATIGGLFGLGGGALDAAYSFALQKQQQKWQEHMSNTAHQREVKDLRAAGLNPILSATGGNGASTPVAPAYPNVDHFSNSAKSVVDFKRAFDTEAKKAEKEMEIADATKKKIDAEAEQIREDTERIKNFNKPVKQGGKLFDALSDSVSHMFSPVHDFVAGTHSAKAAADTEHYLRDLKNSREIDIPVADEVLGSHMQPGTYNGTSIWYGKYRKDGKIHQGYFIKRKGKRK